MASSFEKSRCFFLPHVSFCPGLPYVSTRGNGFNLSKCFIYLGKLSWCAGVCDGTGKMKSRLVEVWCFNADP